MTEVRHAARGRNLSKGETLEVARIRTAVEVELDTFMQEYVYPHVGNARYARLTELVEKFGATHYGRGYVQGGRDEKAW